MNLEKLKKEIEHQSRNGKEEVYIKLDDINELINGAKKEVYGVERIYIGIEAMKKIISAYEKNRSPEEKEKDEFFKRIHVDMPDYKLTRIDEHSYKFEPIKEDKER